MNPFVVRLDSPVCRQGSDLAQPDTHRTAAEFLAGSPSQGHWLAGPVRRAHMIARRRMCLPEQEPAQHGRDPGGRRRAYWHGLSKAPDRTDGWTLLFDGRTTTGWRGFAKKAFPAEGWVVEDGTLKSLGQKRRRHRHDQHVRRLRVRLGVAAVVARQQRRQVLRRRDAGRRGRRDRSRVPDDRR